MKLIQGLSDFLETAYKKGYKMAIGSAAIMYNIDFVMEGLNIRHYFDSIVSADDVRISKPDPETYLQCASQLNMAPADCTVFEDSPKGVEAAKRAGMQYITLITRHHDGFSDWDTKQSEWKITNTDWKQDAVKLMADECHRQGIKLFVYYSYKIYLIGTA